MVSKAIIELDSLDLEKVAVTKKEILTLNAQRYEFEQLDRVVHLDLENLIAVGAKKQKLDEFWTRGHIPERPLMPGVLMVEMAAQLCSVIFHKKLNTDGKIFFGFGGVDKVKFRGTVEPGSEYFMIAKAIKFRPRIAVFEVQGFVKDKMVFEGEVTGLVV